MNSIFARFFQLFPTINQIYQQMQPGIRMPPPLLIVVQLVQVLLQFLLIITIPFLCHRQI